MVVPIGAGGKGQGGEAMIDKGVRPTEAFTITQAGCHGSQGDNHDL